MSKITNDGVTRSGTGCFIAVLPHGNSERQRVAIVITAFTGTYRSYLCSYVFIGVYSHICRLSVSVVRDVGLGRH